MCGVRRGEVSLAYHIGKPGHLSQGDEMTQKGLFPPFFQLNSESPCLSYCCCVDGPSQPRILRFSTFVSPRASLSSFSLLAPQTAPWARAVEQAAGGWRVPASLGDRRRRTREGSAAPAGVRGDYKAPSLAELLD